MQKLNVVLQHCCGIKELKYEFDFSNQSAYAIYAPNGAMKSSLAQTFQDVAAAIPSKDRIFPDRVTTRTIVDEQGAELHSDCVLVIPPYDEVFSHTEKTSTLLVNATLRKEYEQLHAEIDKSKETFRKAPPTEGSTAEAAPFGQGAGIVYL